MMQIIPSKSRMSFTTTSQLNSLLLRGLQVRTNSNTPISTFFALYADGRGGTFWDQALRASDLSSYSTSVAVIGESQSSLYAYTTSSITGMENQIIMLEENFSTLGGSVSTQIEQAVFSFSTNIFFINQLSTIQLNLETAVSSVYSTLSSYDTANFSTLSSYINGSQLVSFGYTDSSISTVYTQSISTSQVSLDAFSTYINNAVLSTSVAFASSILNQNSSLAYYISTDTAEMASTNSNFFIMFSTTDARLSSLEYMSTTLLSTISSYVDPRLSTSQGFQNSTNQSTFTSIFSSLQLISTIALSTAEIAISTAQGFATQINAVSTQTAQNTSDISSLVYSFNLLTTSTLISSIYDSFIGLEQLCSTLVTSTNGSLVSTTNSYISSIYSTIVLGVIDLIEIAFVSTVQSTATSLTSTFVSTLSTIYDEYASSLTSQLDSSIFAYVSTPVATALENFSTQTAIEISTFSTLYNSTLEGTSETFTNFVIGLQNFVSSSALSTLYTEQIFTLSGSHSTASLNLPAYRNFAIFVSDILDASQYRITYDPTALYGMDWKTGTILINVLSTGSYSYNNGKMIMDTYRWGFPTSIYDAMFPTLSSADYTLMYDYRIYNSTIFTSLQNIYPRLRIVNASASGGGGSITAYWSNYSWIPTGLLGSPPFSPQINIDLSQYGLIAQRVGPLNTTVSTITFATSLTGAVNLSIYFAGSFGEGASLTITI
jgi:hypothetical protein